MRYENTLKGTFLSRPNRFIAMVEIDGKAQVCHVKNTGRCKELLLPGVQVILNRADNPARRTQYDLIAVYKGGMLINIDSQAPNHVAAEYLSTIFPGAEIRSEVTYGESRLDFCVQRGADATYIEVKGVTLEFGGVTYFPDAPTERGVRHVHELIRAVQNGYKAMLLFIVQMEGIQRLHPNEQTHPAFGQALRDAAATGVEIRAIACQVLPDTLLPGVPLPVIPRDDRI